MRALGDKSGSDADRVGHFGQVDGTLIVDPDAVRRHEVAGLRRVGAAPAQQNIASEVDDAESRWFLLCESKGPRTYRSRPDPFAAVWDEVCQWLTARPERNGRSVFDELQHRYPGRFTDGQL